ncbi:hypothetical protein G9274_001105 [Stenotrophomonas rhizophila]|nr:hypothetical protein [Stenotrophomonas sp.]QIO87420.1 hypothetical protein G9274_001105 [Stenotrophomonas rhizophila]
MATGTSQAEGDASRGIERLQLERIAALPKAQQRFVMQMLDTVLQQSG